MQTKLTVPANVVYCRGRACDQMTACGDAGCCLYKSSADLFREQQAQADGSITSIGEPEVKVTPVPKLCYDCARGWRCDEHKPQPTVEENNKHLQKIDAGEFKPLNPSYEQGKAKDFSGKITGTGYKASMDDPKKIPLALIDPTYTDGIGRVLRHGEKKYAPGNWLNGMSWREVISALKRHTSAIERGEDVDPETGELHVYHIGCCNMFLARYMSDSRYAQFDDRMFK